MIGEATPNLVAAPMGTPGQHQVTSGAPHETLRALCRAPDFVIGALLLSVVIGVAVLGPLLAPYDPRQAGVGPTLEPPSGAHWLGTDDLGHDVFSRVLSGGSTLVGVCVVGVTLTYVIGAVWGITAASVGGWFDQLSVRVFDLMFAVPAYPIAIIIVALLGSSLPILVAILVLLYVASVGRTTRAFALSIIPLDYIAAATARGEGWISIVFREILPNMSAAVVADYCVKLSFAIITIATLSFLGLGVQPPAPDWGVMVADSRAVLTAQPWTALGPMIAISALVISVNLVAQGWNRVFLREESSGI